MTKAKKIIILLIVVNIVTNIFINNLKSKSFAITQSISSDIAGLDESKYPGIKEKINALKNTYPNWNFKILYTGLNWQDVINNEYVGHGSSPKNLVTSGNSKYGGDWICKICNGQKYDNGNYNCASEKAIEYMMDPRNSLNSSDVFQFQELSYSNANSNDIQKMLSGTFLDNSTYVNTIMTACEQNNVNPYYVVARILQEQGKSGSTLSKGNGYNGQYVGYYNVFNIGASGNSPETIILNGLKRAQKEGWSSLELSLSGGIKILAKSYIAVGQNTLYLQKFDVDNSDGSIYWHQYMQNILAAQNEGTTLRKTYSSIDALNNSYTFVIPVYENMPVVACIRPSTTTTNTEVKTDLVKVNVNSSIKLRNEPNGSKIVGYLYKDEIVTRLEKATSKVNGTYWDKVLKNDGTTGYVARETYDYKSEYKLYLIEINSSDAGIAQTPSTGSEADNSNNSSDNTNSNDNSVNNQGNDNNSNNNQLPDTNANTVIKTVTNKAKLDTQTNIITVVPEAVVYDLAEMLGENIVAMDKDGNALNANSNIGTGTTINGMYTIIKLGDANGDGKVSSSDYIAVKKNIMGSTNLTSNYSLGADASKDGKVSSSDYILIKKYIMGTATINIQ